MFILDVVFRKIEAVSKVNGTLMTQIKRIYADFILLIIRKI